MTDAPRSDQLLVPDERLDALARRVHSVHRSERGALRSDGPGIQPGRRARVPRRRARTLPVTAGVRDELLRGPADEPEPDRDLHQVGAAHQSSRSVTAASSSARAKRYGCACATSGTRRAGRSPSCAASTYAIGSEWITTRTRLLRAGEHLPKAAHVAVEDVPAALAAARHFVTRRRRRTPTTGTPRAPPPSKRP